MEALSFVGYPMLPKNAFTRTRSVSNPTRIVLITSLYDVLKCWHIFREPTDFTFLDLKAAVNLVGGAFGNFRERCAKRELVLTAIFQLSSSRKSSLSEFLLFHSHPWILYLFNDMLHASWVYWKELALHEGRIGYCDRETWSGIEPHVSLLEVVLRIVLSLIANSDVDICSSTALTWLGICKCWFVSEWRPKLVVSIFLPKRQFAWVWNAFCILDL